MHHYPRGIRENIYINDTNSNTEQENKTNEPNQKRSV
jgi:hypothetical protein